jgi:RIO kinase 1
MPRYRFDADGVDDIPDRRRGRPRRRPTAETSEPHRDGLAEEDLSTYPDAAHGPGPVPAWVITSGAARDTDRGPIKTGKEADVHLVERRDPACGRTALMAAKRYRASDHRLFHRDVAYLEGRRTRKSRETRAMATRTDFGRSLIAAQWAGTEFTTLGRLWSAGVPVPYPVQLAGTELLLEFIGDDTGQAAPRLAEVRATAAAVEDLWSQCVAAVVAMGATGYTHGDLSPYNVLVHDGRAVLIDLPQVVDIVVNPQGLEYLSRDCRNLCAWFTRRGVDADPERLAAMVLAAHR